MNESKELSRPSCEVTFLLFFFVFEMRASSCESLDAQSSRTETLVVPSLHFSGQILPSVYL